MPKKGETWTPEQRAKIMEKRQAKNQSAPDETIPQAEAAPRRVPLKAIPQKPKGHRWTMKAGNNWEEPLEDEIGVDRLHIAKDDIPEGMDLFWATAAVHGQEFPQRISNFEQRGWVPVHQEDFDGKFDGKFMRRGKDGPIMVDDAVLMARPIEISQKAKARQQQEARERVQIRERNLRSGNMEGVMGADHPSARSFNHVTRDMGRVVVPSDD